MELRHLRYAVAVDIARGVYRHGLMIPQCNTERLLLAWKLAMVWRRQAAPALLGRMATAQ